MSEISPATALELVAHIEELATAEGFVACGISRAVASDGFSDLVKWIDAGYAADMNYFAARIDAYRHPEGVLPGAKSVIALAYPYARTSPQEVTSEIRRDTGRVARYTFEGTDYHDVIHPKLKRICRMITATCEHARARGIVDTAPLMEREVARLAGLGWRGKNTLLLNRSLGSYFFLACVLVDVELPADMPHVSDHCGTCTACLDACPTDAFAAPYVLDASRCISYLTIENRDMIPEPLRAGIGDWLFGCDVCQEVCPWNRKPTRSAMAAVETAAPTPDDGWWLSPDSPRGRLELGALFALNEDAFRERFRRSPMWRTRRRGLLRNAAIVLGNVGGIDALDALTIALSDEEAIVRASAVWAVRKILQTQPGKNERQRITTETAVSRLQRLLVEETDPIVREELQREEWPR